MISDEQRQLQIETVRLQLAELDKVVDTLAALRERIVDQHDHLIVGTCATCTIELFIGDKGHRCLDDDPLFCSIHAYTWADVKESYEGEDGLQTTDPEAYVRFIADMDAHIAGGGKAEDAILHVL